MAFKFAVVCVFALFAQGISSQYTGNTGMGWISNEMPTVGNSPMSAVNGMGWSGNKMQMAGNNDMASPNGMSWSGNENNWAGNNMALADNNNIGVGQFRDWTGQNDCGEGKISNGIKSYGGPLMVTSYSPIAPTGLRVVSEHTLEGDLSVTGKLPLMGAVSLDGALPATGEAQATYGCGNGNVGIIETFGPNHESGANKIAHNYGTGFANDFPLGSETVSAQSHGAGVGYGPRMVHGADIDRNVGRY